MNISRIRISLLAKYEPRQGIWFLVHLSVVPTVPKHRAVIYIWVGEKIGVCRKWICKHRVLNVIMAPVSSRFSGQDILTSGKWNRHKLKPVIKPVILEIDPASMNHEDSRLDLWIFARNVGRNYQQWNESHPFLQWEKNRELLNWCLLHQSKRKVQLCPQQRQSDVVRLSQRPFSPFTSLAFLTLVTLSTSRSN